MPNYTEKQLNQLNYGKGEIFYGDTPLVILKSFLQSGVSYLGGYPGAPTASLIDAISESYESILKEKGIYFDCSANEASAAALLSASVHNPIRGSVNWKIVGTNVASDALSHICSSGVTGGAMIIVGEDYGCDGTVVAEKALSFALKSSMAVIDPRGDLQLISELVEKGFELSEYSGMPVMFILSTRNAYIRNKFICSDNRKPEISINDPMKEVLLDEERVPMPPYTQEQSKNKYEKRIPAAVEFIKNAKLNEFFPGEKSKVGIITHGSVFNSLIRSLSLLGEADNSGNSCIPILNLNVPYPLVDDEITEFANGKDYILVVEEGMPNLVEQQVISIVHKKRLNTQVSGKGVMPYDGELSPSVIMPGLADFLKERSSSDSKSKYLVNKINEIKQHTQKAAEFLQDPITRRNPVFCTGCPERPIFTAIKILEEEYGKSYYAADIGCYSMSALAPFNMANSLTGMGIGLASSGAISRMTNKRILSFMGDGTFWHGGLTTSIANSVYNNQNAILVILENFWTSMTGHHQNPASGENMRHEGVGMDIEKALRGAGVEWIEKVDPYDLRACMKVLRKAFENNKGLKVIISRGECQLEKNRKDRVVFKKNLESGKRFIQSKLGVDSEVCTGDHSCMRYNGCPSLTLEKSPNSLREDPIAQIDQTCVGCGLCGEIAHAAALCPSFYKVDIIHNPNFFDRLKSGINSKLIDLLQ